MTSSKEVEYITKIVKLEAINSDLEDYIKSLEEQIQDLSEEKEFDLDREYVIKFVPR